MTRLVALAVGAAVLAAACGSDDPTAEQRSSSTTIPVATSTTGGASVSTTTDTAAVPTTDAPTTTTTTIDPRTVAGDLRRAAVALAPLLDAVEPVDTAVTPSGRLWLAERAGTVTEIDPVTGERGDVVIDIGDETRAQGERGLLGIAVDDTALYVDFTDLSGDTRIDAFLLDDDERVVERRPLLAVDQPFSNHNGGALRIGPDGRLYIGLGDGGRGGDPLEAGQDPTQLLGSILRIEPTPDGPDPYAIPDDNPWADGVDGRPEIFAIGLRNPWRIAFDPVTDDLWIADVGQNQWEEIDLLLGANGWGLGANLGWDEREGTHRFEGARPDGSVDPLFEYPHRGDAPAGCSISGGVPYRGRAIAELVGAYVFGDFCTGRLWAIQILDGTVVWRDLAGPLPQLVGITADADGELLALTLGGGVVRVVPA